MKLMIDETLVQKLNDKRMKVCIIDTEVNHDKRFQIMVNKGTAFTHLFPGLLFSLCDAQRICEENNLEVSATGTLWQCID